MAYQLERPAGRFDACAGLGMLEHFQIAYVTTCMDECLERFGSVLGIRHFTPLAGPLVEGGQMRAAFAWVGSVMYEIIEASGPGSVFFTDRLPPGEGFAMARHHLGFLVPDDAQWQALLANAEAHALPLLRPSSNALVDVAFFAVPGMPHYHEYLRPTPAGLAFFNGVARN